MEKAQLLNEELTGNKQKQTAQPKKVGGKKRKRRKAKRENAAFFSVRLRC